MHTIKDQKVTMFSSSRFWCGRSGLTTRALRQARNARYYQKNRDAILQNQKRERSQEFEQVLGNKIAKGSDASH